MRLSQLLLDAKMPHIESKMIGGVMHIKVLGQLHDLSRMAFDTHDKVSFDVSSNMLTTLHSSPTRNIVDFNASNNMLSDLSGGPSTLTGTFNVAYNALTDLVGLPREIGGSLILDHNDKLTTVFGIQDVEHIGGDLRLNVPIAQLKHISNLILLSHPICKGAIFTSDKSLNAAFAEALDEQDLADRMIKLGYIPYEG